MRSGRTWAAAVGLVLAACSPLAGPLGSTGTTSDTTTPGGATATACVYQDQVSSTCTSAPSASAWGCADADCSLVDFMPQSQGDCVYSFQVTSMQAYAGTCADWEAAGQPTTGGTPSGSSSGSIASSSSGSSSGSVTGSGDCSPPGALAFSSTWHPPVTQPASCSQGQLQAFLGACASTSADDCESFLDGNASCAACLVSSPASTSWGPLVSYGPAFLDENLGGCIAQLDPTQIACGQSVQAFAECVHAACDASCGAASTGENAAYQGCITLASDGVCASPYTAASSCMQSLSGPSAACLDATNGLSTMLSAFCG